MKKEPNEWEIQTAETQVLPPELRVARRRHTGQVDAGPHWIRVVEYSAYEAAMEKIAQLEMIAENYRVALLKCVEQLECNEKCTDAYLALYPNDSRTCITNTIVTKEVRGALEKK